MITSKLLKYFKDSRNLFKNKKGQVARSPTSLLNPDKNEDQEARGRGGSTFSPTFLLENAKKPHFWGWALFVFLLLLASWYFNFLHIREIITGYGFTILGLITV